MNFHWKNKFFMFFFIKITKKHKKILIWLTLLSKAETLQKPSKSQFFQTLPSGRNPLCSGRNLCAAVETLFPAVETLSETL